MVPSTIIHLLLLFVYLLVLPSAEKESFGQNNHRAWAKSCRRNSNEQWSFWKVGWHSKRKGVYREEALNQLQFGKGQDWFTTKTYASSTSNGKKEKLLIWRCKAKKGDNVAHFNWYIFWWKQHWRRDFHAWRHGVINWGQSTNTCGAFGYFKQWIVSSEKEN